MVDKDLRKINEENIKLRIYSKLYGFYSVPLHYLPMAIYLGQD
jgi:hypothetical protein